VEQQAQYRQGERVAYRNQFGEDCQGRVVEVDGGDQGACYTIRNEKSFQEDLVQHDRVLRRL
jgi:hypothetical protein